MLRLTQIKKDYPTVSEPVHALKGIDITFRQNEFVSVLGPSGCGKTTLLNIIGGLDRYTSGDLCINGKSTTQFKDKDWDSYRNHSVGFVFQSYNLIPHQTVLSNVELALTLSGVKKKERRRRAIDVLKKVGLGDQLDKKPSQMSGGQMQRVAIARALVNDPDILLADEPTGALDTSTSVQVMDLLKEIAKDRLVIMVTHNPDLAEAYSTRIIKLLDGELISDSDPVSKEEAAAMLPKTGDEKGKVSMSALTALTLSLQNLLTKKGRTILTSFAGSIGIIGIALILALSNGIHGYINSIQQETLTSYPISIMAERTDLSAMMESLMGSSEKGGDHEMDAVYSNTTMTELIISMFAPETKTNNLSDFREYLLSANNPIKDYTSAIHYSYKIPMFVYTEENGQYSKVDLTAIFEKGLGSTFVDSMSSFSGSSDMQMNMSVFSEILPGADAKKEPVHSMIKDQYKLLAGDYPMAKDEILLVLDKNNEVSDLALYALGLKSGDELAETIFNAFNGKPTEQKEQLRIEYKDILGRKMKLILPTDVYNKEGSVYVDYSKNEHFMNAKAADGLDIKIVGIVKPNEDAFAASIATSFAYTSLLTEYMIEGIVESDIVKDQMSDPDRDVFTGLSYAGSADLPTTIEDKIKEYTEKYQSVLSADEKAKYFVNYLIAPTDEEISAMVESYMQQIKELDEDELKQMAAMISQRFGVTLDEEFLSRMAEADPEVLRNMLTTFAITMLTDTNKYTKLVPAAVAAMTPEDMVRFLTEYYKNPTFIDFAKLDAQMLAAEVVKVLGGFDPATQQMTGDPDALLNTVSGRTVLQKLYDKSIEDDETLKAVYYDMMPSTSQTTLADNLKKIGYTTLETPTSINLYAKTFGDKEKIEDAINTYNADKKEEDQITYTDFVAMLMSSVSSIVDFVTYGLIAFVSISLVVSSIMIGIITYISVIERTKEIGILRSIGASKRDIKRVFNAETLIVGFTAGLIGILTTVLLCIPVSAIIKALSGVPNIASLPVMGGIILVGISMLLTFIAGLIPAMFAAKRDPVQALRSE